MSKVYAVDFDGTLCTEEFPNIGKPIWRVIHFLQSKQLNGDKLILWTCREGKCLDEAIGWCADVGLLFDAVNCNLPERINKYKNDTRKIGADYYIDDRNININEIGV